MAWQHGHYYRKKWVDGTCVSEHVGAGTFAELAAALDKAERVKRKARAELDRRERQRQDDLDRELSEVDDAIRALVAGAMLVTGHRAHRRQWRKKRNGQSIGSGNTD